MAFSAIQPLRLLTNDTAAGVFPTFNLSGNADWKGNVRKRKRKTRKRFDNIIFLNTFFYVIALAGKSCDPGYNMGLLAGRVCRAYRGQRRGARNWWAGLLTADNGVVGECIGCHRLLFRVDYTGINDVRGRTSAVATT